MALGVGAESHMAYLLVFLIYLFHFILILSDNESKKVTFLLSNCPLRKLLSQGAFCGYFQKTDGVANFCFP